MNVKTPVLRSSSNKYFYDKMDLRLFDFHAIKYRWPGFNNYHVITYKCQHFAVRDLRGKISKKNTDFKLFT